MTIKLEVGKTYILRNGMEVRIDDYDPSNVFGFCYIAHDPNPLGQGVLTYKEDGSFGLTGFNPLDIIQEKVTFPTAQVNSRSTLESLTNFGYGVDIGEPPGYKAECSHEYLDYFGLNEKFKYCKHCDRRG